MLKVYTKSGQLINLDESQEIQRGGEGRILPMPGRTIKKVAKIYLPNCRPLKDGKFKFLSKLDSNLFVKPIELLYNTSSNPIGFVMDYLDQNYFPLSAAFNKSFCLRSKIVTKKKRKIS